MKRLLFQRFIALAAYLGLVENLCAAAAGADSLAGRHSFWHELFRPAISEETQPAKLALNWVDQGLNWESCFVLPVDDWGVKGVIIPGDLPPYCLKIRQDELPSIDPLYGQLPLTWLNFRSDSVQYTGFNQLDLWTRFTRPNGVFSRFDYYRGDYNFLNFALYAEGNIKSNQSWRFSAENVAYDGYYGLLGADQGKQGESISQSYRAHFRTHRVNDSPWRLDIGAAYQKYFPGLIKSTPYGLALTWTENGKLSEYRAQLQARAVRQLSSSKTALGGEIVTWVYGNYPADNRGAFKGIANQQYAFFEQEWSESKWPKTLSLSHYYQVLKLRRQSALSERILEGQIRLRSSSNPGRVGQLGFKNKDLCYQFDWNWQLSRSWQMNISLARDYFLYPLIYRINLPNWQPIKEEGTALAQQSIGVEYTNKWFDLEMNLMHVGGEFYTPSRQSYRDTLITFEEYRPKALMVSLSSTYTAPWRMRLNLKMRGNAEFWQWNSRLQQQLMLFRGNLCLYLSGEVIYWQGAEHWGWFEELRSIGRLGEDYFINNRLLANIRVDAYIAQLHLFYAVTNVEGRAFSTISGMPYRNMLRIFGVEWNFLN